MPRFDATFFDRITELGIDVDEELRVYATSVLGFDPFAADGVKPGMESFFEDVFYDFTSKKTSPTAAGDTARWSQFIATFC